MRNVETVAGLASMGKTTVLVAEDDENDVICLRLAFERAALDGCLMFVRNGEEAIDYLGAGGRYSYRDKFPRPELLLLDLKMPGTDGFDVLRWLRAHPR